MLDVTATEEAFNSKMAAVRTRRDVIEVVGADAAEYLHGQLSQNVTGLTVGDSALTLLLQPQGKIDARMRLSRLSEDRFWLDVESGFGSMALERLARFKLRVDAELTLKDLEMMAVRGPAVDDLIAGGGLLTPPDGAVLDALWPGVSGIDLLGPSVDLPAGLDEGPPEALEGLRVRLGIPAMGSELDASTIPAAAGIVEASVDFTKGCYVGQELVARIDSRGNNTPTRLSGITAVTVADGGSQPASGWQIHQGDDAVGEVTSYVPTSGGGAVGLGYLKRAATVPGPAQLVGADGERVDVDLVELESS